jgi:lipopolysaccharide/colanic/teichoic acid biosynthesis glycosyltransferase
MSMAPASRHDNQPPVPVPRHVVKSVLDRLGAAVVLLLAAPWLAVIAVAIWLDDGGPVLRRERRLGQWGREFSLLRFRTRAWSGRQDGTVTRVGAFLLRHALDGLPQLLNVLRGDLSFVGPRPHVPGPEAGGWVSREPAVRPGLIEPWDRRGTPRTGDEETLELLRYLGSWSLRADLTILWRWLRDGSRRSGTV